MNTSAPVDLMSFIQSQSLLIAIIQADDLPSCSRHNSSPSIACESFVKSNIVAQALAQLTGMLLTLLGE